MPSTGSGHGETADGDTMFGGGGGGDYYNSLVAAAIIAAFTFVALVIVTALYLKRTTTYKAIISGSGGPMDKQARATIQLRFRPALVWSMDPYTRSGPVILLERP